MLKGIDVSKHQSIINWGKVKPQIDFAILRCGYGSDIASQDDAQFKKNATECERLNIPFAVYLYSYAKSEEMIDSEVAHALRTIGSHKPFGVYIDMEDKTTAPLGKVTLTAFAKRFCEAVKAKGFKVGVYANQYWFTNFLDVATLHKAGYSIWCAKYSDNKPNISAPYDIWQYTSSGRVDGVNGNVDMNYMFNDIRNISIKAETVKKTVDEIAAEVIAGKWGNGAERESKLTAAGYDYKTVQARVNELVTPKKKSNAEIAKEVVAGKWGNGEERKNKLTAAGYHYPTIQKMVNKYLK